jgi:hypothetical protein
MNAATLLDPRQFLARKSFIELKARERAQALLLRCLEGMPRPKASMMRFLIASTSSSTKSSAKPVAWRCSPPFIAQMSCR